jgi:hypothetical protein
MSASNRGPAHPRRPCSATNRRGAPCRMAPVAGSDRCFTHAPEKAPDRAKARRRGGEATRTPHLFKLSAEPATLRDVESVQIVLERTVHETLAQQNGHERSRAIGALLMIALKALEVGELEGRLAALEEQLAARGPRRTA